MLTLRSQLSIHLPFLTLDSQELLLCLALILARFLFTYLGVPIFKGKPKAFHLTPIIDKVKSKLSAWKTSLISMAGRVQLVKSVLHSKLIYIITIYVWPTSLIKDLEKAFRNFIWSGSQDKRKLVTVSWFNVCKPYNEGGLGLRSLPILNEASKLKLCWDSFTFRIIGQSY